jgi:DNA-binding transcriptional LysR family regulator
MTAGGQSLWGLVRLALASMNRALSRCHLGARSVQLRRLRYLIGVAEELSIRRAAKRLGVAQSALTKQIASLEAELGLDLLVRDRRRIVGLTAAGESFLGDARRIIAEIERATSSARGIAAGKEGRLRLGICEDATTERLSRILSVFQVESPDVELDIFEMSSANLVRALSRSDIDLALLVPPVNDESLIVDPVWHDGWLVALPEGHTLAERSRITAESLADMSLILTHLELASHEQVLQAFREAGVAPRIAAQALRRTTKLYMVAAGRGAAFFPGSLIGVSVPGVVMRPFLAKPMTIAAAYRPDPPGLAMQFLRVAQTISVGFHSGRSELSTPSD